MSTVDNRQPLFFFFFFYWKSFNWIWFVPLALTLQRHQSLAGRERPRERRRESFFTELQVLPWWRLFPRTSALQSHFQLFGLSKHCHTGSLFIMVIGIVGLVVAASGSICVSFTGRRLQCGTAVKWGLWPRWPLSFPFLISHTALLSCLFFFFFFTPSSPPPLLLVPRSCYPPPQVS